MPIRIEMPAPGAIYAAYAAGRGKARQRQQKYQMDLLQEQQRLQARREDMLMGFNQRAALQGMRYGGRLGSRMGSRMGADVPMALGDPGLTGLKPGDPRLPTAVDPLQKAIGAPANFITGKASDLDPVQIRAQRKANERARRMGKPIPYPEAEVQTKPGISQREYEQQQEREWEVGQTKAKDTKEWAWKSWSSLKPPPEHANPNVKRELDQLRSAMNALLSPKFDLNEPANYERFNELYKKYQDIYANIEEPDVAGEFNKGIVYWDPVEKKGFNENAPGRVPVGADGKPIDMRPPEQIEQQERETEEQKTKKTETKQWVADIDRRETALKAELRKAQYDDSSLYKPGLVDEVKNELKKLNELRKMPPGSRWIDDDTIQLPTGEVIRRKDSTLPTREAINPKR